MAARIVAYDPSAEYRRVIGSLLEQDDAYDLASCETADQLAGAIAEAPPNLVMVSFADLPDGEDAIAELRRKVEAPIMVFVQSPDEAKAALRSGADYDLPKPFDPEIFVVAVEAVMRRAGGASGRTIAGRGPLFIDDLKVFPDRRTVERAGRSTVLSPTEWQLLGFLIANPGQVFSRRQLAAGAWGPGFASRSRQAELYVSRVRRKIERDQGRRGIIETVRGRGYRLTASVSRAADTKAPSRAGDAG
jgi:DNA-binding response OmpR family regulator